MLENFIEKGPMVVPNKYKVELIRKVLTLLEDENLTIHMALDILDSTKQAAIACTKISSQPVITNQNAV